MVFDSREEEGCQSDRLVPDIDSKPISSVHHDAGGCQVDAWLVDSRSAFLV